MINYRGLCCLSILATIINSNLYQHQTISKSKYQALTFSSAEHWVLEKVKSDQIADLQEQFSNEEDRKLSAKFTEDLILGKLIELPRNGVRIQYAILTEPLNLENAEVKSDIYLRYTLFENKLFFSRSHFFKALSFYGSSISDADFSRMKVDEFFEFDQTKVSGEVTFLHATIGENFRLRSAHFMSEKDISFNGVHVGNTMLLNNSIFDGGVDFTSIQIGSELQAFNTRFTNPDSKIDFNSVDIGSHMIIKDSNFSGELYIYLADIGGEFWADGIHLLNANKVMTVGNSRIGDFITMRNSEIWGGIDFSFTIAKSGLFLGSSKFLNLEKELKFSNMEVGGITEFDNSSFAGRVNLSNCKLHSWSLDNVTWPKFSNNILMTGMTYQEVIIDSEKVGDSWEKLLNVVNNSSYNVNVYKNLENFFYDNGYPEWAKKTHIEMRRRERAEILTNFSPAWWWNLFLDITVNYGSNPGLVFVWSGLIIILGSFIFGPIERMQLKELSNTKNYRNIARDYSAFWYSVDLFIPGVDFGLDNYWIPKPERRFARNYMRFHILLGWLLIPIGILALTGIIR